jgi:uncharacterized Zn-binding protein involved in type VI secretion
MSRPLIVVGDRTDHGGTVIEGSATSDTAGKLIARVGDKVTCPRRGHGISTIVSGDPSLIIDGAPVARHGDKCACGATLLSSQVLTYVGLGSQGSSSKETLADDSVAASIDIRFDRQFLVVDHQTKHPLSGVPYRLTLPDGARVLGKTDETGLTERIGSNICQIASLEAPYYGDLTSSTDTTCEHDTCCC